MELLEIAALVDARRLSSTMAVVQAAQVVRTLEPGAYVEVLATDPGTAKEIAAWCRSSGNELVDASTTNASLFRFVIQRS